MILNILILNRLSKKFVLIKLDSNNLKYRIIIIIRWSMDLILF